MSRTRVLDREAGRAMPALGAAAKTGLGDPVERAALAPAEGFVPDEVHERAAGHSDEAGLARRIGLITVINGWNHLMVGRRVPPKGYRP